MAADFRLRARLGDCLLAASLAFSAPVHAANTPPTARGGNFSIVTGGRLPTVLALTDPDPAQTWTHDIVSAPAHGSLTASGAGEKWWSYDYAPDAGYTGPDSFSWKANDGFADSNIAAMSIDVTPNTLPRANAQSMATYEGALRKQFLLDYTDPDSQNFVFTAVTSPGHGKLEYYAGGYQIVPAGSGLATRSWYYTPDAGYIGPDSFSWKLNDGMADSNIAAVSITVASNTVPVAVDQKIFAVLGGTTSINLSYRDPDIGQPLTFPIISGPAHGTLTPSGSRVYYTPAAGYSGADSFAWRVNDGRADSDAAVCDIWVRSSASDFNGMTVLLVARDLLLPEIEAEVDRLKADMEREGYTAKIKPWSSSGAAELWNYLRTEYRSPGQFVAGAVLIGNIPFARGMIPDRFDGKVDQITDYAYMNMETYRDTRKRHIWVSRMRALSYGGAQLYAGPETILLKRALDANHDYRTGASRLPHAAYHYDDVAYNDYGANALQVWPRAEELRPSGAFVKGGEFIGETSHGGPSAYDNGAVNSFNIHDKPAQVRFVSNTSCAVGAPGGITNNQLLTRGGGNVLSGGASDTTYTIIGGDGVFEVLSPYAPDPPFRARLAGGDGWGNAFVAHDAFNEPSRGILYGDLSLRVKAAPANQMPVVGSLGADRTRGFAPLSVNFSASAGDPDGSISNYEWFPEGHFYGKVEPAASGASAASASHTYALPHRYPARVEVTDTHKARSWKEVEIQVNPRPGEPMRVNCGANISQSYASRDYYSPGLDYVDTRGDVWLHDQRYAGGTWGWTDDDGNTFDVVSANVLGTEDDTLYQRYRYDYYKNGFTYTVPVQNGGYTVHLHFADMENTAAGQRLTDVSIEGVPQLTAFDIVAAAGPRTAVKVTRHVNVADGAMNLLVKTNPASPSLSGCRECGILNAFELIPDSAAPTVLLTSPSNGSFVAGTVAVSADAFDDAAVLGVRFRLDGSELGPEISTPPYAIPWDTASSPEGLHILAAEARDDQGNVSTSAAAAVTVDNTPPSVLISFPSSGAVVSATVTVVAQASDSLGVAKVIFRVDGIAKATDTTAPYAYAWNTSAYPNGSHLLQILAYNRSGLSASTSTAVMVNNAGIDITPPSIPTGLAAAAISSTQINLAWNPSTDDVGVAGYKVFRCQGAGCSPTLQVATRTATGLTDAGLTPDTTYAYRISAFDAAGNVSALSASASTRTWPAPSPPDTTPPSTPAGLAATAVSSTQINLAWNPSTDDVGVAGYKVFRCQGAGCSPALQIATRTATGLTDAGLTPDTTYAYRVSAFDAAGNVSALSAAASTRTWPAPSPPDTTPPSTPTGLAAAAISSTQINLAWNPSTDDVGVAGYKVFRCQGAGCSPTLQVATRTATGLTDAGLTPDTTYAYRVSAFDAAGNVSALSASASTRTPPAPAGYLASSLIGTSGGSVGDLASLGVLLSVPPGALSESATFYISPEDTSNPALQASKRADEQARGMSRASQAFDIRAVGSISLEPVSSFPIPLELSMAYDTGQVSAPSALGLFYWNVGLGRWQAITGAGVKPSGAFMEAQVAHLTTFAVFQTASLSAGSSGPLAFGQVFAYPNPAHGGKITLHAEIGPVDSLEIKIYDLKGVLLHRTRLSGPPSVGINGRQAYEYSWDLSGVAAGTYLYSIKAVKAGQFARVLGKLAVIR